MTSPTDAEAQAIARPGESWAQARLRAQERSAVVIECEPCGVVGCGGWIEQFHSLSYCEKCSLRDLWNYDPHTGREYPDV